MARRFIARAFAQQCDRDSGVQVHVRVFDELAQLSLVHVGTFCPPPVRGLEMAHCQVIRTAGFCSSAPLLLSSPCLPPRSVPSAGRCIDARERYKQRPAGRADAVPGRVVASPSSLLRRRLRLQRIEGVECRMPTCDRCAVNTGVPRAWAYILHFIFPCFPLSYSSSSSSSPSSASPCLFRPLPHPV